MITSINRRKSVNTGAKGFGRFFAVNDYATKAVSNFRGSDALGAIFLRFRTDTSGNVRFLYSTGDEVLTNKYFGIGIRASNKLQVVWVNGGTSNTIEASTVLTQGVWYNAVVLSTGTAYQIWVNGVQDTLTPLSGSNNGAWLSTVTDRDNLNFAVIKTTSLSVFFNGAISEIVQTNSVPTGSEISNHNPTSNIVGKWRFATGSGTELVDDLGLNNLTLINTVASTFWQGREILQQDILRFGVYRKACKFDSISNQTNTGALTNAQYQAIIGSNLPFTVYWRGKLPQLTDGSLSILSALRRTSTGNSRAIVYARGVTGNKLRLQITTISNVEAGTARITDVTLSQSYTPDTYLELTISFVTTTAIKGYFGDIDITGTQTGSTLINPNTFTSASDYVFSYGYDGTFFYNNTPVLCAIFPFDYTPAQCRANLANAPFRCDFSAGYGNTLYNKGTGGSTYNLTATGITETSFHTMIKE